MIIGFYIGMWLSALGTCAYGLWYVLTHAYGGESDYVWAFYLWLTFGPIWMLALRLWKWIFTLTWGCIALSVGGHELKKVGEVGTVLTGAWAGWQMSKPENQARVRRWGEAYGEWLIEPAPGTLVRPDPGMRYARWVMLIFGALVYYATAFSAYPHHTGTYDTPIAEPTPPVQRSYSQNTPVIHSSCRESLQLAARSIAVCRHPGAHGWDARNAPKWVGDIVNDPEIVQATYNHAHGLYTNSLKWKHRGYVYHWDDEHDTWTRKKQ